LALADPPLTVASPRSYSLGRLRAQDIALAGVMLAFVAEALFFVFAAYVNRDEGWYMLAGKSVLHGELPYRDFPYFQTPLLPYVFGAGQSVFGAAIIGGRLMSALMALASLSLLLYISERIGGRATTICAGVLVICTPGFVLETVAARSESIVVLLVLAALAVAFARPHGFAAFVLPPAILLVATAARLTFLPAFGVALVYCYWRARPTKRQAIAGVAALVGMGIAVVAPLAIAAPRRAWFDMWTAQAIRNAQFEGPHSITHRLADRIGFVSLPANTFFVVLIPALFALVLAYDAYTRGWRPRRPAFAADFLSIHLLIIGFAVVLWLPYAGFDHQEDRYFIPSFALLAIVAADLFARAAKGLLPESARLLPPVFIVLLVAHAVFQYPLVRASVDTADIRRTDQAGQYIARLMGPGDQLVSLNPTLALASGRPLAPPLMMGQFSFWPAMHDASARHNGVVNVALLEQLMLDPRTKVIALDDYDLGLISQARDEDPHVTPNAAWPFKLFPDLIGRFTLVDTQPNFGQFSGTLYILERVPEQ
jgi:4-amino-4-deoxy-L-arabinose transferase-like glycosyltransferase